MLKKQRSDVESAAVIIGPGYSIKSKELLYREKRMEALVNLLKTYKETEKDIEEIRQEKDSREKINKMFGI